jgi:hypothetical protein
MCLQTEDKSEMIGDGNKQKGSILVADGDNHLRLPLGLPKLEDKGQ